MPNLCAIELVGHRQASSEWSDRQSSSVVWPLFLLSNHQTNTITSDEIGFQHLVHPENGTTCFAEAVGLREELRSPTCRFSLHQPRLRVMPAGSKHVLHYDESHTLLIQTDGVKTVTLIPVMQLTYLYPHEEHSVLYRRAQVDLLHPDYKKYPLARQLQPSNYTMQQGDLLFIPRRSAHQTLSISSSVSVSLRVKLECEQR